MFCEHISHLLNLTVNCLKAGNVPLTSLVSTTTPTPTLTAELPKFIIFHSFPLFSCLLALPASLSAVPCPNVFFCSACPQQPCITHPPSSKGLSVFPDRINLFSPSHNWICILGALLLMLAFIPAAHQIFPAMQPPPFSFGCRLVPSAQVLYKFFNKCLSI